MDPTFLLLLFSHSPSQHHQPVPLLLLLLSAQQSILLHSMYIVQHSLLCIEQPAFLFHHIFLSAYTTLLNWPSNHPSVFAHSQHQHRPPTQHLRLSTYTTLAARNRTSPFQQRPASFSINIQHTLDQHSGPWFSFSASTSTISHQHHIQHQHQVHIRFTFLPLFSCCPLATSVSCRSINVSSLF